jgi:hypothetical protein
MVLFCFATLLKLHENDLLEWIDWFLPGVLISEAASERGAAMPG